MKRKNKSPKPENDWTTLSGAPTKKLIAPPTKTVINIFLLSLAIPYPIKTTTVITIPISKSPGLNEL